MANSNPPTNRPRPPAAPNRPAGAPRPPTSAPARRRRWRIAPPAGANLNGAVFVITAVVVVVVAALLAFGYWDSYIRPAREAAVVVGDRSYNMTYFARRLRDRVESPTSAGLTLQQLPSLPARLGDEIVVEEVLVQRAGMLGLGVSDDEIDGTMAEQLSVPFSRDEQGQIQRTAIFTSSVRNALRRSGLSLAEFRRAAHAQALRTEMRQYFQRGVPAQAPAVRIRQIVVTDEAKAKELKQQLDGGADFAELAAANNLDTTVRANAGLREWTPKGGLPVAVEQAITDLPLGQVSDPIQDGDSYSIVRIEERADSREISEQERSALASKQFDDWMTEQRRALNARNYLALAGDDRIRYALEESGAIQTVQERSPGGANPLGGPGTVPQPRPVLPGSQPPAGGNP